MIQIKANRLHRNAGHTSKQLRHELTQITGHARLQDPTAVFTNPNDVVLKDSIRCVLFLCIPWRQYTTAGLIHPRVNPWCSVFDRINYRESEIQMALDIQNIFDKIKVLNIRTLLTSLSIVFFLYFGIAVGYFYYLSP